MFNRIEIAHHKFGIPHILEQKAICESYLRYPKNNMRDSFEFQGFSLRIMVSNTNKDNPFVKREENAR